MAWDIIIKSSGVILVIMVAAQVLYWVLTGKENDQ